MPSPAAVNVRTLDLNLSRDFDVVMAERKLPRATDRLSITRPAVSDAGFRNKAVTRALPFELETRHTTMRWHRRHDRGSSHEWPRARLIDAARLSAEGLRSRDRFAPAANRCASRIEAQSISLAESLHVAHHPPPDARSRP